jgi:hypothetical protein
MQEFAAGKFHFEPPFTSFDRLVGAQKERLRDREARVLAPPDQPKVRKVLGHEPLNVQVPLSGVYEVAGEVPAPERLVRAFGHHPRTV